MKERFLPTPGELANLERFFQHIEGRIEEVSRENEQITFDLAQTNLKRGQILAFRELLRLGKPPQN